MSDIQDPPTSETPPVVVQPLRPAPNPPASSGLTFDTLAVVAFIMALFAVGIGVFAVGLASRAVDEAGSGGGGAKTSASDEGNASGTEASTVVMTDFHFDPMELKVKADSVLTLENKGSVAHDLTIGDVYVSDLVDPGKTGEADLSGIKPGTYDIICDVPGHADAGMTGTMVIE